METELNFDLEKKQVTYLQADNNYCPPKYLGQFSAHIQEKLIAAIPEALTYCLPKYRPKTQPCNCVKCGKIYASEQSAEEMGQCWTCHFSDSQKCLEEMERFVIEGVEKRNYSSRNQESYMPNRIGEEKKWEVQKYYRERLDGRMKKKEVYKAINEVLNLDLTQRESLALLDVNAVKLAAKKRGYLFN